MPVNDFRLEGVLDPTDAAAERDRILAQSDPVTPTPPVPDHPMTTYGRGVVAGMYPAGFNPRAAPQQYRGAATLPSAIASNTDTPVAGYTQEQQAALYQTPIFGGLARVLNSPLARTFQPSGEETANPLYALGPVGELTGPVSGAAGAIAGKLGQGAREAMRGRAPNFASEAAGMARIDLGVGGGYATEPRLGQNLAETAQNLRSVGVPQSAEQAAAEAGARTAAQQSQVDILAAEIAAREANLGVNIDKLAVSPAVKDYVEQVAQDNAGFVTQRRGVISVEETIADAAKAQLDAARYAHLRPGTALNAEQITALKGAMSKSGEDVVALLDKQRAARALGLTDRNLVVQVDLATSQHAALQQALAGARAESGRALRIQREVTGSLASGKGDAYDVAVNAIGGRDNQEALLKALNDIWTDPALASQAEREQAAFKFIANLDKPKFFDRIDSYRYNAMLSGIPTQLKNTFGQLALLAVDTIEKPIAAGYEAAITVGGKIRPRETYLSEAAAGPVGAAMGLGNGFRRALAVLKTGQREGALDAFKSEGIAKSEVNAGILNIATRGIAAVDEMFSAVGYSKGLYEGAAKQAAREGKPFFSVGPKSGSHSPFLDRMGEVMSELPVALDDYATAAGDRAAMRGKPGAVGQIAIKARDINILPKAISDKTGEFRPLRMVVPFVNTPLKVLDAGVSYSPAGLFKLIGSEPGARADILARATLGSIGMGYIATQYAAGNVTGAVPTDPARRDAFYRSGKLPYSIKVNGQWIEYGSLDPISFPLRATARILDAYAEDPSAPIEVVASKAAFAVADAFKDASFLSGFSSLIDALDDPEHRAEAFLGGLAKQFVPAAARNATQASDPFIRQPNGIVEQIESVFPGLNQNVPTRTTVYGDPALRPAGKQGIAGNVSPVNFNADTPDPIDEKLKTYSLPELLGPDGRPLPVTNLQVGFVAQDIASYRLSPQEGARYQQYAGQATHNLLTALFADQRPYNGAQFSTLNPVDQVRAIRATIDDARTVGRSQVADEIVHAASDSATLSRGVDMRLSTLTRNRDRATYLEGLQAQGKMSGAVASYIDQHKSASEPSVAEYLAAAPLVREYLAEPPYRIGNPLEWAALGEAKKMMSKFLKSSPAPRGEPELDWFQRANPEIGALIRRYSYEQVRNPKRVQLYKAHPELERYVDGVTADQQTTFTKP